MGMTTLAISYRNPLPLVHGPRPEQNEPTLIGFGQRR